MFKTPAKKKREALLDKVLGPLSAADQEAIRKAFISGISRDDLIMLAQEAGLVRASTNLTGGIDLIGPAGEPMTQDDLGFASGPTGYVDRPMNVAGMTQFPGFAGFTTGITGVRTTHVKQEAEAPFSAVRVWVGTKSDAGTAPVIKALVGTTDTGEYDTVAKAYLPRRAGTDYNAAYDSSGRGWKPVTWAGADSGTIPWAPVGGQNGANFACSDWIPLNSVARADVPGGRPMALLRLAQTDAAAPITAVESASTYIPAYQSARGEPWYREWISALVSNDGITTLTNIPANLAQSGVMCWIEFKYDAPARSVVTVGDSTMECRNVTTYKYDTWVRRALAKLSTQSAPISVANFGASGRTQAQFNAIFDKLIEAGAKPTDVIYQSWSQNGFTKTAAGVEYYLGEMLRRIETLRGMGITVWLSTGYAATGYPASDNALRNACNNKARAWAAAGIVRLIDVDAIVSVDDGDGTASIRAEYDSGDGTHVNTAGVAAIAAEVERVWY